MPDENLYYGLVNKPPIDEIYNLSLVNKPDLDSEELTHWGILGMKWGIRRYQNKDGTLTELGKKRLEKVQKDREFKAAKKAERQKRMEEAAKAREAKKREKILKDPDLILKYEKMFSNDDIKKAMDRIRILNDVRDLSSKKLNRGKKVADDVLGYGKTLNSMIDFLNSNAGKGLRQLMGFDTKDLWKFNKNDNNNNNNNNNQNKNNNP